MKTYVLDASALLCMLGAEPGYKRVAQILKQASENKCRVFMSAVNWGEVAYKLWVMKGEAVANRVLSEIESLRLDLEPVTKPDALGSARLKALHHLHYADAFAAALALREKAVLVTADTHFERVGKQVQILWLR